MTQRKEYGSIDAAPSVLYAKRETDNILAFPVLQDNDGNIKTISANNLVPSQYDYIALTYSGSNLSIVEYKTSGSSGTLVATLTLAYSGSTLTTITKT
jgi:hypothetical protein